MKWVIAFFILSALVLAIILLLLWKDKNETPGYTGQDKRLLITQ